MSSFFINCKKTLSATFQFAADGCALTKFELVWVAMQLKLFLSHKIFTNCKFAYAFVHFPKNSEFGLFSFLNAVLPLVELLMPFLLELYLQ